jgi:dihydroxyacid dehydratase/phosphogluconate dehydratase
MGNAVRMHSASGGSTNLLMHLVGAAIYAGAEFSIHDLDRIHHAHPVPDLFNYSLTEGRDIFALAKQCCSGDIRGMETLFHELVQNGVPMDLDALTVTGSSWRERLSDTTNLSATGVAENPVILATPRRAVSGVDVLQSNWFESAVVKISGMPERQVNQFDETVGFVLFYETEEAANESLLDIHLLDRLRDERAFGETDLRSMWAHNAAQLGLDAAAVDSSDYNTLFDHMVKTGGLKIAIVITSQGPEAYGMPEMFTPMQHINANRSLRALATLISDGRYSGVSYGAAVGHVTPEAARGGQIAALATGDLLHLRFRKRRIDWIDPEALQSGSISDDVSSLISERDELVRERMARLKIRQRRVAATNRMANCTDASKGVVPSVVWDECQGSFWELTSVAGVS